MIELVEIEEPRNLPGAGQWDLFVSYTATDQVWAEWIVWQLEAAGYQVLVQAWDTVVGSNWSAAMRDGIRYATRTIAVLSGAYLSSVYGRQEWQAATLADPDDMVRKLLAVRVEDCARPGLLGRVVSFDLFGLSAQDAYNRLLSAIRAAIVGRAKPASEPAFSGPAVSPILPQSRPDRAPAFPGRSAEQPLSLSWLQGDIHSVRIIRTEDQNAEFVLSDRSENSSIDTVAGQAGWGSFEIRFNSEGITDNAQLQLQRIVQRFTRELVQEASRLEETDRRIGIEKPEVTANMVAKARESLDARDPPRVSARSNFDFGIQVVSALTLSSAGVMGSYLHANWQVALFSALAMLAAISTAYTLWRKL
jgi:TIR domain